MEASDDRRSDKPGELARLPRSNEDTEDLDGTESWLSTEAELGLSKDQSDGSS